MTEKKIGDSFVDERTRQAVLSELHEIMLRAEQSAAENSPSTLLPKQDKPLSERSRHTILPAVSDIPQEFLHYLRTEDGKALLRAAYVLIREAAAADKKDGGHVLSWHHALQRAQDEFRRI